MREFEVNFYGFGGDLYAPPTSWSPPGMSLEEEWSYSWFLFWLFLQTTLDVKEQVTFTTLTDTNSTVGSWSHTYTLGIGPGLEVSAPLTSRTSMNLEFRAGITINRGVGKATSNGSCDDGLECFIIGNGSFFNFSQNFEKSQTETGFMFKGHGALNFDIISNWKLTPYFNYRYNSRTLAFHFPAMPEGGPSFQFNHSEEVTGGVDLIYLFD